MKVKGVNLASVLAWLVLSALLVSSARAQPGPPAAPDVKITFSAQAVVVEGATPGGDVILFGVARHFVEMSLQILQRQERLTDGDKDGAVRLELAAELDPQSVWVAIDLTSGVYTVAHPEGSPFQQITLPPGALRAGGPGHADLLDDARRMLTVLLVRPSVGAWLRRVGDGGASDLDGRGDGRLTLPFDELEPVGSSPPLAEPRLRPKDLVVAVDSERRELYVTRWAGPPQG